MSTAWRFERVKPVRAVDGDTVVLDVDTGFNMTGRVDVRLLGVNTPERGQPGYAQATAFTADWIAANSFALECHGPDKYGGRWLGILRTADGRSLALELIDAGLGVRYDGGKKP
jgi:micrococcal nuclease